MVLCICKRRSNLSRDFSPESTFLVSQSRMSLKFTSMNKIDKESKYLVFGYHRDAEKALLSKHGNNTFYHIPRLVVYRCLAFYYAVYKFLYDENQCKIDEHNVNTITKYKSVSSFKKNCTFIGEWMNKGIITLKLRISVLDVNYHRRYFIGIVPNEWDVKKPITLCQGSYCYEPFGYSWCVKKVITDKLHKCIEGDTLSLILDCTSSKLFYKIEGNNREKNGVISKHIDMTNKKYKFAITMYDFISSVIILHIYTC